MLAGNRAGAGVPYAAHAGVRHAAAYRAAHRGRDGGGLVGRIRALGRVPAVRPEWLLSEPIPGGAAAPGGVPGGSGAFLRRSHPQLVSDAGGLSRWLLRYAHLLEAPESLLSGAGARHRGLSALPGGSGFRQPPSQGWAWLATRASPAPGLPALSRSGPVRLP